MPHFLLLETSGRVGQVGLAEGNKLLCTRRLDEVRRHARDLAPAVAQLLVDQQWQATDLDAVIVSRGPGSYTGLRVGIMSAKALAYAAGCRIIAVDTFAVIAGQAPADAELAEVIADAQQGKLYVQTFRQGPEEGIRQEDTPLTILASQEWLSLRNQASWLGGPGVHLVQNKLPASTKVVDPSSWDPALDSLLRVGHYLFRQGKQDDVWKLEPLYARPSSAEEKWDKRKQGG